MELAWSRQLAAVVSGVRRVTTVALSACSKTKSSPPEERVISAMPQRLCKESDKKSS